jgi:hypothetical protein
VELLTVSEVSRRSGVSRTSIYRLQRRGVLRPWSASGPGGRPMLRAEVVDELKRGQLLRQRIDSPWAPGRDRAPAAPVVVIEPAADALELEPPYGAWPADSWEEWAALGWADWRPDEQLSNAEHWANIAGLLGAWLSLSAVPLDGTRAASLCLAADEAREAVAAGVRWNPERWAAAVAADEATEQGNTPPGNQAEGASNEQPSGARKHHPQPMNNSGESCD